MESARVTGRARGRHPAPEAGPPERTAACRSVPRRMLRLWSGLARAHAARALPDLWLAAPPRRERRSTMTTALPSHSFEPPSPHDGTNALEVLVSPFVLCCGNPVPIRGGRRSSPRPARLGRHRSWQKQHRPVSPGGAQVGRQELSATPPRARAREERALFAVQPGVRRRIDAPQHHRSNTKEH